MPDTTDPTGDQRPTEPTATTDPAAATDPAGDPETFPREYVQQLRDEAAGYRVKAKATDALRDRLVTAYAAATGRLADPTDLPYDPELLDDDGLVDEPKVRTAVQNLLTRKPHLATRRPTGDVAQGARTDEPGLSLVGLLRGTA